MVGKKNGVVDEAIKWFMKAVPLMIVAGILVVLLSMLFAFITSFVGLELGALASLILAMILLIVSTSILGREKSKQLTTISLDLVLILTSMVIVGMVIALIPSLASVTPFLLTGEITLNGLVFLLAELTTAEVLIVKAKKMLKL